MAFRYETGTADDIPDFFVKLEALLVSAGWTIEDGTGTTTIIIRSTGESGGRTKFYARIRRNAGTTQRVYVRLQDDLAGTNSTTDPDDNYTGYMIAPGAGDTPFVYWIAADKDMIQIAFKAGAGYTGNYIGIVEPFAVSIPDEEYQYVAVCMQKMGVACGRVLRNYADAWNQIIYAKECTDSYRMDPLDNSCALMGGYVHLTGAFDKIVGQLLNTSGRIESLPSINPEDTITTGFAGATSTWIVLGTGTQRWAIRTGGIVPVGQLEGAYFSHEAGVASSIENLNSKFEAFVAAIGWTKSANGSPIFAIDYNLSSPGESGVDDIWLHMRYDDAQGYYGGCVMDDAGDTHHTTNSDCGSAANRLKPEDFPTQYWFTGDRDCVFVMVENEGLLQHCWLGMYQMFNPDPDSLDTPYKVGIESQILRGHDGSWVTSLTGIPDNYLNSSPNLLDGSTVVIWPSPVQHAVAAIYIPTGVMKYIYWASGATLSINDQIAMGARIYTYIGNNRAIRT